MTVASEAQKVTANGNDAATVFSFSPLIIYQNSDLTVTLVEAGGTETLLVEGVGSSNYSITIGNQADFDAGVGSTGSITYPASGGTPLATGDSIVIKPVYSFLQQLDLENQGGYFADLQETAFDKLHRIAIQMQEEIDRSVKVTIGSGDDPDTLVTTIINAEASASASATAAATAETNAAASAAAAEAAVEAAGLPTPVADTILIRNAGNTDYVATNAADTRTFLSLVVGTNVQAFHAVLSSLSTVGPNLVEGDILYATAANTLARLAHGTEGQVIKSVSGVPAYADESGGAWQEIAEGTLSTVASLDIVFTPSSWRAVKVILTEIIPANSDAPLYARTDASSGASFDAGASDYSYSVQNTLVATDANIGNNSVAQMQLADGQASAPDVGTATFEFTLWHPNGTSYTRATWLASVGEPGGISSVNGAGARLFAGAVDAIRFLYATGNIASGQYKVLGLAE